MSSYQDSFSEVVQRRPHLSKDQRVPKCYKEVEKILKSVKSCKQNFKTILANSRLRGTVFKKVYNISVNVLKNYNYIEKIMDKVQLLEKEKFLRKEIASVLVYELLFGKGFLPGESKAVTILKVHENSIRAAHETLQNNLEESVTFEKNIPRYARVHTLVTTVPYVIKDLESYGFKQIFYDENLPEEKYLELVQNLEKGCFLVDFHFKDILVFECQENLVSLELYKNGHIFLQDKASYIPVHVLNPEPSSSVLDACAAPGMKTLHIASKMKNKGILIACERDKSRFESLKQMIEYGSVKICKMLCKDFKLIDPTDQAYSVDYILLDPSCSGSGMVNRMDEVTDTEDSKNKERLMKLAGFQIILLKHALKFPSVKRVVYSTCSVHEEENEYVVHEALGSCNGTFKLVAAMPGWSYRGSENYEFGKLCLRTVPEKHLTNGFFVAVFERVDSGEYAERRFSRKHKTQVDGSGEINLGIEKQNFPEFGSKNQENKSKKHKSKKVDNMSISAEVTVEQSNIASSVTINEDIAVNSSQNVIDYQNFEHQQKKKKKHKKNKNEEISSKSYDEEMSSNMLLEPPQDGLQLKHKENVSSSKKAYGTDDFTNEENSPLYKTKKAKRAKGKKEMDSPGIQTALFPNDLDSPAQYGKYNMQIECTAKNVPIKKKKHKKHSKNLDSDDAYRDFSISFNITGSFSQLSEKNTENSNVFEAQEHALLENEETSLKKGKKRKCKYSDKDLNSVTGDMVGFDNTSPLNPDDNEIVYNSKRHKNKKHKS